MPSSHFQVATDMRSLLHYLCIYGRFYFEGPEAQRDCVIVNLDYLSEKIP